ncbi:acyl-CoA-binding protein [Ferrimonas lipolytica]|uniref:Acyl-CoA-binding protein n=1 Tax=Ferrimonas lipolytica TaxID=2724191 RepID=A0A6H1UC34_9GAMM|nr:acyl-CoA-binding protein [Ferrimonas lipolytica]QIZ76621.1 acyl-CoA-binding protein [Ferrimonas lipolytica]
MDIHQQFEQAQEQLNTLTTRPNNDMLLSLYSLFKQASEGDCTGTRPSAFSMAKFAKFTAWEKQAGRSAEECMEEYIDLVKRLVN